MEAVDKIQQEGWDAVGLDSTDVFVAVLTRDGIKREVATRARDRGAVCNDIKSVLASIGRNLTLIHLLDRSAHDVDARLAQEQTQKILEGNRAVQQHVAQCEKLGQDWSDAVHDLMLERPGPAPAETTSDEWDIHLCTELSDVVVATEEVESRMDELHAYFGESLSRFLKEQFPTKNQATDYIQDLLILSVYIGPVAEAEAYSPRHSFQVKGRAVQHLHAHFGDQETATDDRYLYI